MTSITGYSNGQFSWIDLITPDLRASRNFYSELFDWDMVDVPVDRDYFFVDFQFAGRTVAGMQEMPQNLRNEGKPAVWASEVNVHDIDAVTDEAEYLGATIEMPPKQILDLGRMAVLVDPLGTRISLWEPGNQAGAEMMNRPASLCWNELITPNPDISLRFYGDLFDWTFQQTDELDLVYYEIFNNGRPNGGVVEMNSGWAGRKPHWMPYVSVFDCDVILEKVVKLGGTADMVPIDIAPGRFSVIVDPLGAAITVMKLNAPAR